MSELKKRRGETDGVHIEEVYSSEYGEMQHDLATAEQSLAEHKAKLETVRSDTIDECLKAFVMIKGHEAYDSCGSMAVLRDTHQVTEAFQKLKQLQELSND